MNKDLVSHYEHINPFTTKDGSIIRELMHPASHQVTRQSLAEATVGVGGKTLLHRHLRSEELYFITQGHGVMTLGDQHFKVSRGQTVCIAPGTAHCIENVGSEPLIVLCSCAPAYRDDDTQILE